MNRIFQSILDLMIALFGISLIWVSYSVNATGIFKMEKYNISIFLSGYEKQIFCLVLLLAGIAFLVFEIKRFRKVYR
jgi:TRAP-type C4-dicarboxylate transport system permease small subunit